MDVTVLTMTLTLIPLFLEVFEAIVPYSVTLFFNRILDWSDGIPVSSSGSYCHLSLEFIPTGQWTILFNDPAIVSYVRI